MIEKGAAVTDVEVEAFPELSPYSSQKDGYCVKWKGERCIISAGQGRTEERLSGVNHG